MGVLPFDRLKILLCDGNPAAGAASFHSSTNLIGNWRFNMLISLVAISFTVSSLLFLFVVVSVIAAILRLAAKNNDLHGVLKKDSPVLSSHPDVKAATSIFDGEDIIGGSPLHLPEPIGPKGTSFTFRVYAPPSVDKEIPKVDLVGTLEFIKTGKVRKFVPIGAKRLLVVNLQDMTLEVYVPKRGRKRGKARAGRHQEVKAKDKQDDLDDTLGSLSDDVASKPSTVLKPSGINLSTKKLDIENNGVHDEDDTDDVELDSDEAEELWSRHHFKAKPKTVLKLQNLISVSALSPVGGVIEILSLAPNNETKVKSISKGREKETVMVDPTKKVDEIDPTQKSSMSPFRRPSLRSSDASTDDLFLEANEWFRGSDATPVARNAGTATTSFGASNNEIGVTENAAELFEETNIVGTNIDEAASGLDTETDVSQNEVWNDEFVFCKPRDGAEFQRIVMALRTSGEEIKQLYETLEVIQANSEAHFPTTEEQVNNAKKKGKKNNVTIPKFVSAGVALDDAWRCLNDVAVVSTGLKQYRHYSTIKLNKEEDIIAAAANDDKNTSKQETKGETGSSVEEVTQHRKDLCEHYRHRRALLGLRDFFSLFVPPLPLDSPAVPYFCPCVASESMLQGDYKFSGVEVHRLRLRLASTLQLRVGSASIYVRAYARAKAVVQEGWQLDLVHEERSSLEDEPRDDKDEQNDKESKEDCTFISREVTRLAYDNERENLIRDYSARNETYEPSICPSQGYLVVGWHRFAIPPASSRSTFWLRHDNNPVETIPSLREIVAKHPDLHFCVIASHNQSINVATYYLLVRSLPVGVDVSFDDSMNNFINSSAKERDKKLELRVQIAPGHSWSSFAKVAIQFVTAAIFGSKIINPSARRIGRISFPSVVLSKAVKLTHFGGRNYVSLNAHWSSNNFLRILFRNVNVKKCTVDYAIALNTGDIQGRGRVLSVIRMVNMDVKECAIPTTYRPSLPEESIEEGSSNSDRVEIEPATATSFWDRVFRFGAATKEIPEKSNSGAGRDELYSNEIDIIWDILDGVHVPVVRGDRTENKLVRLNLTRADIERFIIACECDLNATVKRIIKSTAWRYVTFPIDRRMCTVELASMQFFHQGKDKQNNPIFYFRNSLLEPWANNVKSTILMVLHRLETFFSSTDGLSKVTVIVLTGSSKEVDGANEKSNRKKKKNQNDGNDNDAPPDAVEDCVNVQTQTDYHIHSNFYTVQRLCELLSFHYPERLNKALIVPSKAFSKKRISNFVLSTFSPITQTRVVVLNSRADLKKYVNESELICGAGGTAKMIPTPD